MKRIFFFATKSDILAVTNIVEERLDLMYILSHHGLFSEHQGCAPKYESAAKIPTLGIATRRQTTSCERYLVVNRATHVEPVTRVYGGVEKTEYEQGNCPDAIEFNAGGFWENEVLINGLIQTWSESTPAQQLMRAFFAAMKKTFKTKVNAYWIGPEAFQFLKDGGRLTLNVDANPSFDIKIPH
ncbi:hypothetical protein PIN31009_00434 [Pandoraea iniqua]|uniref:hypothetical protein n=1 Tax=Pandoraea iniqua TaxID=2508288 RepID=UPI00123FEB1E|nr:hypothetical protein [Pandoraea iniqua]VVD67568.1 hypothetical protein PIN31009_00434 [Pandoraea iniqua]